MSQMTGFLRGDVQKRAGFIFVSDDFLPTITTGIDVDCAAGCTAASEIRRHSALKGGGMRQHLVQTRLLPSHM